MNDSRKTKAQLISELKRLRKTLSECEQAVETRNHFDEIEPMDTERSLGRRVNRYQNLIDAAQEGIWIVDAEATTTFVNDQLARMLGYTADEMLRRSVFDFIHEADWREARRHLERGKQGLKEQRDFRFRRKDGSDVWAMISTTPLFDDKRTFVGGLAMLMDVSDRKRAELALRESEAKFRALAETAAAAIFIYRGVDLVYVNRTTETHTGYSREELLKKPFLEVVHPESRELVKERALARQRDEPVPGRYEFKILTKTGETRWVDATASSVEYEGQPAAIGTAFDITDRKRVEEALHKSQARLEHVLLCSPAIVYSLRPEDDIFLPEWVSESITRLTGYTTSEALSSGWWDGHLHPEDRERVFAELALMLDNDRLVLEYRFQHKDGGYHWLHDELRILRDESGNAVEALGSWTDVTERREAEAALRDSEERFRTLVNSIDDLVFTVDSQQRHSGIFGRLAEKFKLKREFFIGKKPSEILGLDAARIHEDAYARALRGEQIVYEWSLTNDRGTFHLQSSVSPISNQNGEITGLVGVARDITERKQAEEALRESQAHLQAILDNCPAMIFQKDLEGRYLQVNREFEHTFNLPAEQVLGRTDDELFQPDLAAAFRATDRRVLEAGRSLEFEEVAIDADGPQTYIVNKFPLRDSAGNVYAVGGISTDITARKHAEDELKKQKEILQTIFDHIPVMIRFRDKDGRLKLVNREWERTLGWSLKEIESRGLDIFAELYPDPEYRQYVLNFIAASTGEFTDLKIRVRDGRVIDSSFANVSLEDGTNIGIGRDITERKQAEEALRDSEERFRRYFELGLIGIAITSPNKGWLEVNDRICETLGYERSELLQTTWAELTHPDDLSADVATFKRVLAGEIDRYSMDKRFIRKDGRVIDTTIFVNCVRNSDGSVAYFVGLMQDISDRKRAEELLQRQAAQLGALHEIELEISAESELSRVLEVVTRRAGESQNASHCAVFICDRERADLAIAASLDDDLIGVRLKEGEGLAGRVVATGEAQAVDNYSLWEGRARVLEGRPIGPRLAVPLKWQHVVIGAITVAREPGGDAFTQEDSHFLQQIAAEAAIAIHQATLFEEIQEGHKRLQVLAHSLIDAQEAERKRLARELHDRIGQALTAVQINLQSLQSGHDGAYRLEESLAIVEDALKQAHDLSLELRPSLLDDLGLVAALRWYVDHFVRRAKLLRSFNADSLDIRLAPEIETACFRIAQEALTNVVRHAHATTVWVQLKTSDSDLQLIIKDDGKGFSVRNVMSRNGSNTSLGLQGIRERAVALGGLVEIVSGPGQGTEVRASFPLKDAMPASDDGEEA